MDCSEAIRARRSVRKFKEGVKIPSEHLKLLLEAAMCAPSAVNSRPWEFFIAESEEAKAALMAAHPASRMLATASLAIVVCGRPELQPNFEFWPQDCAAAVENILLQATALGYGSCWRGCFPAQPRTDAVRRALGGNNVPVAIVAIGVPAEQPAQKGFFDPDRVRFMR